MKYSTANCEINYVSMYKCVSEIWTSTDLIRREEDGSFERYQLYYAAQKDHLDFSMREKSIEITKKCNT